MSNNKFILFLLFFLIPVTAFAYRIGSPPTLSLPLNNDQVNQTNDFLRDVWLQQQGEQNLDIVTTTKTRAENGDFWVITTGTTATWQFKALDVIWSLGAGTGGGSTAPGGADGNVQYNNGGSFGGEAAFFYDDVGNNVGIGTSTPSEQLEITGNFEMPTTSSGVGQIKENGTTQIHFYGTDNTFIGNGAGNYTTTASSSIGIGTSALTALTSGARNTAIGSNALKTISTSADSTAVGWGALRDTTGAQNTAVGSQVMTITSTGAQNTGVGASALGFNTTGSSNSAFGYSALTSNTEGIYNTAVGLNALVGNSTGNYNTTVGADSLDGLTGDGNTALGYEAGGASVTGNYNTFIGYQVAVDGTYTGDYNIGVGTSAINNLTSGSNNICIGRLSCDNASTMNNSIALGDGIDLTTSNTVVIGNTSTTNVGIGVTAPTGILDVKQGTIVVNEGIMTGVNALTVSNGITGSTVTVNNANHGSNAGQDVCIGQNNTLCICGSCN